MISSIVSYHTSVNGCGVAKFSAELARRMNLPFVGIKDDWGPHPLLSLKWSELSVIDACDLYDRCEDAVYSLFWHDKGEPDLTRWAQTVFSGDPSLPGIGLWCPPTLAPVDLPPVDVTLLSLGMSHKLQVEPYRRVRALLEAAGLSYRLKVSVAIHEGTSIDDAAMHFDALDDVMGQEHVQMLGCLSDSALAEQMQAADVICAFFPNGVRVNNTTVHAATSMGKPVLTILDGHSPRRLGVANLYSLQRWPSRDEWRTIAAVGHSAHQHYYTWDHFIFALRSGLHAANPNRRAVNF